MLSAQLHSIKMPEESWESVVCECMSDELKGCKKASELIQWLQVLFYVKFITENIKIAIKWLQAQNWKDHTSSAFKYIMSSKC